jgi:hypothetical protein
METATELIDKCASLKNVMGGDIPRLPLNMDYLI